MKRIWITLLVVAVALMLATPAAGKGKPDCDPASPNHPSCQADEPDVIGGTTCIDDDTFDAELKSEDFFVELGGKKTDLPDQACIDVMTYEEGRWVVTITGGGGRQLTLVPRDAVGPGDSCGGFQARGEEHIYGQWPLPLEADPRFDAIPAATVNACRGNADPDGPNPDGDFAEWIEAYPGNEVPALWDADAICAAVGAEAPCGLETALSEYPHPLVLQAFFGGSGSATAKICVDLPPLEPIDPDAAVPGTRFLPEVCE